MAEAPAPETSTAPAPAASTTQPSGLEKVYSDFKIEDVASEFQQQSPQPAAQPEPKPTLKVPDAFDPNFTNFQAQMAQGVSSLHQAHNAAVAKLNSIEQRIAQREIEQDIKQAVGTLIEGSDIKPKVAEVALEAKAREDRRFLQIWKNRGQNPAAYNAALKAFKSELESEYSVRRDPQLTENQRAMKTSQQQMATTQRQDPNDEWSSMNPGERQAKIRMLITRG